MKAAKFPVTITEKGVSAIIRESTKLKGGKTHKYFIVEFILLGKRKQVWRSDFDDAKAVASEACIKVANGDQSALELRNGERMGLYGASSVAFNPLLGAANKTNSLLTQIVKNTTPKSGQAPRQSDPHSP